jgi:Ca2+-transporting ATPase
MFFMKYIFSALLAFFFLFSCADKRDEKVLKLEDLTPSSARYKESDSAKNHPDKSTSFMDSVPISYKGVFDFMKWDYDSVHLYSIDVFSDRFKANSKYKFYWKNGLDSVVFMDWVFKDSLQTSTALYNLLDCFGPSCKTIKIGEKVNFQKQNLLLLVNDQHLLIIDSEKKIMATLHMSASGEKIIYLKGAPESVIPLLSKSDNSSIVFRKEQIRKEALQMANTGMRVLAFASRKLDSEDSLLINEDNLCNFNFLGIQAMSDPPRTEVKEAIETCHKAGITVKMITGDHPSTASAIGRELGFENAERVITGKELQNLNAEELQEVVKNTNIFARVSPEDKLNLVKALQTNGEVVAMTGDGVNDSPALKRADIGVAMGISGTAVAKDAADMILADDNFKSIVAAVEEGRRVFDNLLKSIVFLLPTSIGLGLVIFIAVLFFPTESGILLIPMQPVQVLWINLITAVALSLPLALEVMDPDVMNRPPRKPSKPLLSPLIIFRIIMVSLVMAGETIGLFLWVYNIDMSRGMAHSQAISEAQTMAVTAMVLFQAFYLIDCRSLNFSVHKIGLFSNPSIYIGIATVLFLQTSFVYFPFMNRWFHSSPLKADAWGMSAMVAFSILITISIEKWVRRKYFKNIKV